MAKLDRAGRGRGRSSKCVTCSGTGRVIILVPEKRDSLAAFFALAGPSNKPGYRPCTRCGGRGRE